MGQTRLTRYYKLTRHSRRRPRILWVGHRKKKPELTLFWFWGPRYNIVVTGGRSWVSSQHRTWLEQALAQIPAGRHTLIHGGCRGLDLMAGEAARVRRWKQKVVLPDWSKGRAGGPLRNQAMIDRFQPHYGLAFFAVPFSQSRGTKDCYKRLLRYSQQMTSRLLQMLTVDHQGNFKIRNRGQHF